MKTILGKIVVSCVALGLLSAIGSAQDWRYEHYRHHYYQHSYWTHPYQHSYWTHRYWMRHHYWHHHDVYWRDDGAGYWGYRNGVRVWIRL